MAATLTEVSPMAIPASLDLSQLEFSPGEWTSLLSPSHLLPVISMFLHLHPYSFSPFIPPPPQISSVPPSHLEPISPLLTLTSSSTLSWPSWAQSSSLSRLPTPPLLSLNLPHPCRPRPLRRSPSPPPPPPPPLLRFQRLQHLTWTQTIRSWSILPTLMDS